MNHAPIFFLAFGYWMASNKQMLSNDHLVAINRKTSATTNHHTVANFVAGDFQDAPTWPMPLLVALLILN